MMRSRFEILPACLSGLQVAVILRYLRLWGGPHRLDKKSPVLRWWSGL